MKKIFALSLFSLVILTVNGAISWPKLECKPGYHKSGGEHASKSNHVACARETSKDPKMCMKECYYRWIGIMVRGTRNEMSSQKSFENTLLRNYFQDDADGKASATEISTKVFNECKDKLTAVKDKPCKQWTDFYACVDGIVAGCESG